jgi:hypothetical protein
MIIYPIGLSTAWTSLEPYTDRKEVNLLEHGELHAAGILEETLEQDIIDSQESTRRQNESANLTENLTLRIQKQ